MSANTRIENEVRTALQADPRIKHPELIAVSADEIGAVVLRGAVESLPQRTAAVHDARKVDGVFEVIADHLRVHPPVGELRADDELCAAAMQRLTDDAAVRSTHIHVKVMHGWVTLSGYVRQESERAAAVEAVASLTGVLGVTDQIEVRQ